MCHFQAQNGPFAPNKFFLVKTIHITFIYLLAPFIVQNFQKILPTDPVMRMCYFWAQNDPFPPNKNFLEKSLILFSSIYWPLLLYKLFKKFLLRIQSCEDAFWAQNGPKWPICPNEIFFQNTC